MIQLYKAMLRCYPRRFRQQFADEMQDIFAETLAEAAKQSLFAAVKFCLREASQFPQNVMREHLYERTRQGGKSAAAQAKSQDTLIARWIVRIAGMMISGFLLFVTFIADPTSMQGIGMLLLFLSLLVTWRWEKAGGLLVMGAAVLTMMMNALAMPGFLLMGLALIGSGLFALPFVLFGWFFYRIGRLEQGAAL